MKITFFERQLIERGTTVAVFDYTYYISYQIINLLLSI